MRRSIAIAAAAALTVSAGAAQAADLYTPPPVESSPVYAPPPFTWTGFYVGLQAGYAFGDHDVAAPTTPTFNLDPDGFVGGAHAGFNYQWNALVLGIEGDVEFSGIEGKLITAGGSLKVEGNWQGSIRARLGYAIDRLLIYGTGGWAFADVDYRAVSGGVARDSTTFSGWTLGAGAEYAITDNVTARVEYRYTDFGDENIFSNVTPGVTADPDIHTVRVGVSYKF
jgi:outer membrane immunogenic protein